MRSSWWINSNWLLPGLYVNMQLSALLMDINAELVVPEEAAAFQPTSREQESPVATLFLVERGH